jgi:hypothetical protein
LEIVKGTGKVTHIQERLSTLQSDRKRYTRRRGPAPFNLFQDDLVEEEPFDEPRVGDLARPIG